MIFWSSCGSDAGSADACCDASCEASSVAGAPGAAVLASSGRCSSPENMVEMSHESLRSVFLRSRCL